MIPRVKAGYVHTHLCGSSTVYIQVVLNAPGEAAVEEGDGSADSGVQRSQGKPWPELLTPQSTMPAHSFIASPRG